VIEQRFILHVDMDAFFASVEQLDDPSLRGRPVLVGHKGPRGVVAAASYEARKFGCHSAQPMSVALRNCPHAVVVPGHFERYRAMSRRVFEIFERFTPLVEPVSIDEAYLDVSGSIALHGPAEEIAKTIKRLIRAETGLTASVGVAPNKFLAKLASDMNKPDGLAVIGPADVERILPPMAVGRLWGIGKKTEAGLAAVGIKTVGDLRRMPPEWMASRFGSSAEYVANLARGIDERIVVADSEAKSIGHEQTFETNLGNPQAVREVLLEQVEQVAARVRRHGLVARRVSLKIRFGDFQTISRSRTLAEATDRTEVLLEAAGEVFDAWAARTFSPVRLIGMSCGELGKPAAQLALFSDEKDDRAGKVDRAVDAINAKFGKRAIHRAGPG
jgi:DNA polymerase-4